MPDASSTSKAKTGRARAPLLEVRKSDIQGRGAFALRPIRKGQRIIEYTGERISNEEADARYDESKMKRHHTFLFSVTPSIVVDGAVDGSDAIYINHSCAPNCEAVIENRRIYIEALRAIQPGEELGYDYQYERTGNVKEDREMERFYKCLCGAPTCRGSILVPEKKPRRKSAAKRSGAKRSSNTKTTKNGTKRKRSGTEAKRTKTTGKTAARGGGESRAKTTSRGASKQSSTHRRTSRR